MRPSRIHSGGFGRIKGDTADKRNLKITDPSSNRKGSANQVAKRIDSGREFRLRQLIQEIQ